MTGIAPRGMEELKMQITRRNSVNWCSYHSYQWKINFSREQKTEKNVKKINFQTLTGIAPKSMEELKMRITRGNSVNWCSYHSYLKPGMHMGTKCVYVRTGLRHKRCDEQFAYHSPQTEICRLFAQTQRELNALGALCSPQVRGKQTVWFACVYRPLRRIFRNLIKCAHTHIEVRAFGAPRVSAPMAQYYDSQLRSSLRWLRLRHSQR